MNVSSGLWRVWRDGSPQVAHSSYIPRRPQRHEHCYCAGFFWGEVLNNFVFFGPTLSASLFSSLARHPPGLGISTLRRALNRMHRYSTFAIWNPSSVRGYRLGPGTGKEVSLFHVLGREEWITKKKKKRRKRKPGNEGEKPKKKKKYLSQGLWDEGCLFQ